MFPQQKKPAYETARKISAKPTPSPMIFSISVIVIVRKIEIYISDTIRSIRRENEIRTRPNRYFARMICAFVTGNVICSFVKLDFSSSSVEYSAAHAPNIGNTIPVNRIKVYWFADRKVQIMVTQ